MRISFLQSRMFLGLLAFGLCFPGLSPAKTLTKDRSPLAPRKGALLNPRKAPQLSDWRFFQDMKDSERASLWMHHTRQGLALKDWIWGWRMAWVKACTFAKEEYCGTLLETALSDKAMVVRAEAATRLGERFEGRKDNRTIQVLAEAFKNPRNSRNGKPLFVQQRILFAIKQVGGSLGEQVGEELAKNDKQSSEYWHALRKL